VYLEYERLRRGPMTRDMDSPFFRYEGDATYDLAKMILAADEWRYTQPTHPLARGLEFIVVDEMHDMNWAMFLVLKGLLQANENAAFAGVGDMDQVIHVHAGADAYFMRQGFDLEAGKPKRLPLSTSYRSGEQITSLLERHAKKPYAPLVDRRSRVELIAAASALDVYAEIDRALEMRRGLQPKSPNGELAVLLRHPSQAVELENHLLDHGIWYATHGFDSYLKRVEVLFVRGILLCALDAFEIVEVEATRHDIVQAMLLFTGGSVLTSVDSVHDDLVLKERESVARLAAGRNFGSYFRNHLMRRVSPHAAHAMASAMNIARSNRVEDMADLVRALDLPWFARRVLVHASAVRAVEESVNGLVNAVATFDSIERFLHGTNDRELTLAEMLARPNQCIKLMTIDAAKGLEFDHVIVPGVNSSEFDDTSTDERNLFYVAASRARHVLTLMFEPGRKSSFLASAVVDGDVLGPRT
jgi:DNA helicase-2/ATP-dependent DNA helicase PcrA